jgi:hypothetical protein
MQQQQTQQMQMQMQMKEYKWSFGEKPERSFSQQIQQYREQNIDNIDLFSQQQSKNANLIDNAEFSNHIGEFRKGNNKRENVNEKLNERYSIGQVGQNPFNTENNYIKDLEVQQNFLIPKSSYDELK